MNRSRPGAFLSLEALADWANVQTKLRELHRADGFWRGDRDHVDVEFLVDPRPTAEEILIRAEVFTPDRGSVAAKRQRLDTPSADFAWFKQAMIEFAMAKRRLRREAEQLARDAARRQKTKERRKVKKQVKQHIEQVRMAWMSYEDYLASLPDIRTIGE